MDWRGIVTGAGSHLHQDVVLMAIARVPSWPYGTTETRVKKEVNLQGIALLQIRDHLFNHLPGITCTLNRYSKGI